MVTFRARAWQATNCFFPQWQAEKMWNVSCAFFRPILSKWKLTNPLSFVSLPVRQT
jgi:hypothetical protein